jgi:hypothetical protein
MQNMWSKFGSIRRWRGSFQVRDGKDANYKYGQLTKINC